MARGMSVSGLTIRPGDENDGAAVIAMFDEAVAWLVERGQTGQWGATPFSERPGSASAYMASGPGAGCTSPRARESRSACSSSGPRRHTRRRRRCRSSTSSCCSARAGTSGAGIGSALVNKAIELGYERKAEIVRVDCWAHAPGLVRWYEKQGFTRSNRFELNGWQGQIFTMEL